MTPLLQQPLSLGADIVVHSGTKFLGGHNDTLAGLLSAKGFDLCARLGFIQNATGAVLSPFDSWLIIRGIKTLSVRMRRSQENAVKIAEWLSAKKEVADVYYPGLEGHHNSAVHKVQTRGPGAMLSFTVKDKSLVEKIINNVKIISFAESLGGIETLITYPVKQTHADIPVELRNKIVITDDLLRLSIGIEDVNDLIQDLKQAIEK
jgi:cystathionine gamma-synthase